MVRTVPFQGANRGSTPLRVNFTKICQKQTAGLKQSPKKCYPRIHVWTRRILALTHLHLSILQLPYLRDYSLTVHSSNSFVPPP